MKVLLTGATGLLGGRLAADWRGRGMDLVALGHESAADDAVDLIDRAGAFLVLDKHQPDVIVNLAALSNVDACEDDPQKAYLLNVRAVEILADWCRRQTGKSLLHISTDHVYDGPGSHGEEDVTLLNMYAFSKYAGELAALAAGGMVLRTNFFGRSDTPGRLSFSDSIIRGLSEGAKMRFFKDVFFCPLSLDTLSAMLAKAAEDPEPGVFNLGASSSLSKSRFARLVAESKGLSLKSAEDISLEQAGLQARRPKGTVMDVSRFEKRYGVTLPTLEEEIKNAAL